ncbi:MAG: serine protease [Planctomycetes bacterium]|nr:serine protease [Planctomycetota bacterium]
MTARLPLACMMAAALTAVRAAVPEPGATPRQVAAAAARRVVKLYGAGGIRGLEAYQSGIVVSADGHILTVFSTVLDADLVTCVFDDGRRAEARVVGVDPRRELALLSVDAEHLTAFEFVARDRVRVGTRVLAASNLFGVAVGDERVSVQRGVIAAVVPLEARRASAEAPYGGAVYLLDCTTSNPGSAGGALVDARGELLGMLGKESRSMANGVWLNYAIPADELVAGYGAILSGAPPPALASDRHRFDVRAVGVVLVPDLLDGTPPFVDAVVADSPAAAADVRPDDLVIVAGGRPVASRLAVEEAVGAVAAGDAIRLTLVRDGAIVEADLGPRPADTESP